MLDDIRQFGNIKFLAVARAVDRVMVASYVCQKGDIADQYTTAVREVLSAPDFANKVQPGSRYRLAGDVNAFNFTTDAENRVYIVISGKTYPERLVFPMINDLVTKFKQEFGTASLTCAPGALDGKARRLFQNFAEEYDDPTKKDKLSEVQEQVGQVKKTMNKNIDVMLQNIDRATDIEESTKVLQDQAAKFHTNARVLKKRELCKQYKTTACIVFAILLLLGVILLATVAPNAAAAGIATMPPTAPPTLPGGRRL